MDFQFSPEEEAFRAEVVAFLDENLPPEDQRGGDFMPNWFAKVREKRWVGFSWPKEVGGGGGRHEGITTVIDEPADLDVEVPGGVCHELPHTHGLRGADR